MIRRAGLIPISQIAAARPGLTEKAGLYQIGSGGSEVTITATVPPATQAVGHGDTWADLLLASATDTANYSSTAGTISSVVAEVQIDGGAWVALAGNTGNVLDAAEGVTTRVTVTDSAANEKVFLGGTRVVSGTAPTITASDSLAGRTLTITAGSATGTPSPSVTLSSLTLDSVDVLGDATGSGPWEYVVPDSDSAQTVAWEVTATNFEGSDAATGSETVAANLSAPTITASDSLVGRTLTISVDSSTGTPSPSFALTTLTLDGSNVLGSATGSGPWQYVVPGSDSPQTVAWEVTATNTVEAATASDTEIVAANLFSPLSGNGIAGQAYQSGEAFGPLDVSSDFTGTEPITYALAPASDSLPDGLSLSGAGVISGTPSAEPGTVSIIVRGTNAYGSDDTSFDLFVAAITATVSPQTQPAGHGDTWADLLLASATDTANYSSTTGTISSAVAEVQVNGGAWTALAGNTANALSAEDTVSTRVTVTDSSAAEQVFQGGEVTVSGIAPTVTASDSLAGRTLTITVGSVTGTPTPTTALSSLTLGGVDVLADATGSGPWAYVVPDSESAQTVAWEITATNSDGSATSAGTEVVAGNIFELLSPDGTDRLVRAADDTTTTILIAPDGTKYDVTPA